MSGRDLLDGSPKQGGRQVYLVGILRQWLGVIQRTLGEGRDRIIVKASRRNVLLHRAIDAPRTWRHSTEHEAHLTVLAPYGGDAGESKVP